MLNTPTDTMIDTAFAAARERYAAMGVDVDAALRRLATIPVSIHCWQGDDVSGFEGGSLGDGGILATGGYPGKARNAEELRADLERVLGLVPGSHRVNLHSIYAETGGAAVDRNALAPEHFQAWMDWARAQKIGLDFNGSFFSHPRAADGFTLSHPDKAIRDFWIEHGIACREIGEAMGRATGSPCVVNVWVPDGYKDMPVDRLAPRERLRDSLDALFARKLDKNTVLDAVECKLFGIGSESYVVGSHEFYMGYAVKRGTLLCLDAGHFHPTETISDKLSSCLLFLDEVLLHVSRGVRWDSDHVVILSDDLRAIAEEVVRHEYEKRVHIGLDFFDASINRIAAWTIGTRAMLKALLLALLEPTAALQALEAEGDYTARLLLLEELKSMPFGAVWDHYCRMQDVPVGATALTAIRDYESNVLSKRG